MRSPGAFLTGVALAGALVGSVACNLDFGYEGKPVAELTPVQQRGFCDDAALQMARSYVGSFKALCALAALDPETCVETFDSCAAEYDPGMMTERSVGVVAGEERCLELFDEGAFAGCEIDAGLYVACATETAAYLAALDGEQVCTAPADDGEQTDPSVEPDGSGEAGDAGTPDDAGASRDNEHTPSCAEMERLCPDNPFTPATIGEAAAADDGDPSGDAGTPDPGSAGSDGGATDDGSAGG